MILRKTLKDFDGIEAQDIMIQRALLNFSVLLATGNVEDAYNAVRQIQNNSIW